MSVAMSMATRPRGRRALTWGWLAALICASALACGETEGTDADVVDPGGDAAGEGLGHDAADTSAPDTSAAAKTAGTFTVLTYNIKGLPGAVTGWDTGKQMQLIAPKLNAFDLVGLQEDFIEVHHKAVVAEATHTHQDWFSAKKESARADGSHTYGSGLTLLARMSVVATQHAHYASCEGLFNHANDCLASKGVMVTRLKLSAHPDAELDVYNTHLEAGGSAKDEAVRAEQIQHLAKLMTTYSKGRAVLFMGDTNLHPHQAVDRKEIQALDLAAGLTETCATVQCPEPNHIDRVHYRSSASLKLQATAWKRDTSFVDSAGEDLSDHPAITATFSWQVTAK